MRSLCLAAYLVIASIFSAAQSSEPAQAQGYIIGSVVNDSNEPVGHAIICTSVVGTNSAHTECDAQRADADGHFGIRAPLETNRIFAENPQAGYQEDNNPMEQGENVKHIEME